MQGVLPVFHPFHKQSGRALVCFCTCVCEGIFGLVQDNQIVHLCIFGKQLVFLNLQSECLYLGVSSFMPEPDKETNSVLRD